MISDILILVLVGVIWGSTNYLIEIYYKDSVPYEDNSNNDNKKINGIVSSTIIYLRHNYRSLILFLCNQSGSVLFYFCLGTISLSLTVIVSNSVSFFTAVILEIVHKKKQFSNNFFIGMTLIVIGLSLCSYNNTPIEQS